MTFDLPSASYPHSSQLNLTEAPFWVGVARKNWLLAPNQEQATIISHRLQLWAEEINLSVSTADRIRTPFSPPTEQSPYSRNGCPGELGVHTTLTPEPLEAEIPNQKRQAEKVRD